ncbi:hypothetical protein BDN70DRAFT_977372 [Pholiota conissans]|uniref:Uncharacterized protein n=1 Tax=Pholiota conissans TaxID=109636 RepID=A0A9P5Z674_9AGAR|nr:hypothetical protein BDN70DRAFT_977372 [Pholiota conissans]
MSLSVGQGVIRLLQFSGVLSSEMKTKLQLHWWSDLVKEYFTPRAVMKLTLWRDSLRNEAKPFEIGVPILPRFFLVTTQSGVKSMSFTLDGARERSFGQGHSVVECVSAVWTYRYTNGYTVTLRGPLTVHVIIAASGPGGSGQTLKFEDFQFDANTHDKLLASEAIAGTRTIEVIKEPNAYEHFAAERRAAEAIANGTAPTLAEAQAAEDAKWEEPKVFIDKAVLPGEPVNAFGIPQATMRCLELAESVSLMGDLISFASENKMGPKGASC